MKRFDEPNRFLFTTRPKTCGSAIHTFNFFVQTAFHSKIPASNQKSIWRSSFKKGSNVLLYSIEGAFFVFDPLEHPSQVILRFYYVLNSYSGSGRKNTFPDCRENLP
ncbi:hypothetical protein LEP1GSC193_4420 [Leptospira alstonii serovar Pingchang str. 80-412]|uniref:Uncharacterized protein n=2 Tax=Leptospira alstonii TaxID=28452 RepID=M6DGX7_9LEPT|nr:hypothetical protein LEP1GSC194_0610 [Leptospira alstonii serovar Sichuan str. 79601]EQA80346.1 hypothetical protein LEP1GSC193_4420 [Leptospira alstonii serovar Pingchang str. 80-412]